MKSGGSPFSKLSNFQEDFRISFDSDGYPFKNSQTPLLGFTKISFMSWAVDDSIIDRKLIETLLKISSYQVTAVDSGSKALEFLGLHEEDEQSDANIPSVSPCNHHQVLEVNLIITDYCMPGMTGYDLLRKIKESKSLKDIPVVIMSSENEPSRINRCLEDGAEEFFLKPVQLSDVNKLRPHLLKGSSKGNQHTINKTDEATMEQENQSTEGQRNILYHDLEVVQLEFDNL